MIEDQYKFISVDIPRTACSERCRLIAGMPWGEVPEKVMHAKYWREIPKHAKAMQYKVHSPEKFKAYFVYSFVRNPWDRMVSFFRYRQRRFGATDFRHYILKNEFGDLSTQQIDYLTDQDGRILVDFIGRFENLYEDFDKVCRAINFQGSLEYSQEKKSTANYWAYYDDRTRKIVAKNSKKDIEYFGYSFLM